MTGVFTVTIAAPSGSPQGGEVLIYNMLGEKVKELTIVTNKATEIQLQDVAGVYFISASTAAGNYEGKVVVGN